MDLKWNDKPMNRPHWLVERLYDPIGVLVRRLNELNFRRYLGLVLVKRDGRYYICIHDKCMDRFKNVEFFGVLGCDHRLIEVSTREQAMDIGALGLLCCCAQMEVEAQCEMKFVAHTITEEKSSGGSSEFLQPA